MIAQDRLVNLLLLIAAGWLVYLLAPILTPFVAAFLLAYVGDPMVDRLQRLRLSRTVGVVFVFLLTFLFLTSIVVLIGPLVRAQAAALIERLPGYVNWIESRFLPQIIDWLDIETVDGGLGIGAFLAKYGAPAANWAGEAAARVSRSGAALLGALVNLVLIPVLTFYLLRDWDRIIAGVSALLPERNRRAVTDVARETDKVLGAFLRGQILVMLALATIYSVGLWMLGIDYALAIGVISGVVSFVPYLGLVVGIALAGVAAIAQTQSLLIVLGVVAVFVVGQLIEGMVLTPRLVGERIGLHPVLVIFAVMAGGQLFGFFGVLLALPAAAVVAVLVRFAYNHYFTRTRPPESPGQ